MAEAAEPVQMDQGVIADQLRQMFPQFSEDLVDETVQRYVERSGLNHSPVVIMNHCIEEMLSMNAIMNDDIIVIGSPQTEPREVPRFGDGHRKLPSMRSPIEIDLTPDIIADSPDIIRSPVRKRKRPDSSTKRPPTPLDEVDNDSLVFDSDDDLTEIDRDSSDIRTENSTPRSAASTPSSLIVSDTTSSTASPELPALNLQRTLNDKFTPIEVSPTVIAPTPVAVKAVVQKPITVKHAAEKPAVQPPPAKPAAANPAVNNTFATALDRIEQYASPGALQRIEQYETPVPQFEQKVKHKRPVTAALGAPPPDNGAALGQVVDEAPLFTFEPARVPIVALQSPPRPNVIVNIKQDEEAAVAAPVIIPEPIPLMEINLNLNQQVEPAGPGPVLKVQQQDAVQDPAQDLAFNQFDDLPDLGPDFDQQELPQPEQVEEPEAVPPEPEPVVEPEPVPPEPEPPREPTPQEIFDGKVSTVLSLFPLVDPDYLRVKMEEFEVNQVEFMVNHLLEHPKYPRKEVVKAVPKTVEKKCDFYDMKRVTSETHNDEYRKCCLLWLQKDFRRVSVKDLRKLAQIYNHCYAIIYKALVDAQTESKVDIMKSFDEVHARKKGLKSPGGPPVVRDRSPPDAPTIVSVTIKSGDGSASSKYDCKLLKFGRSVHSMGSLTYTPELKAEVEYVLNTMKMEIEERDRRLAEVMNESEYETTGQLIECGCCYGESPFELMVQCYEGHLFCRECLKNYGKEAVYGQGKSDLACMSDGCDATFPKDQLERALPPEMLQKYEERLKEEALNLADLEDLVRCPHCDFAALLPPGDKVFRCQNQECLKETCRHCKEEWTDHFGIPCKELEKKDETKMRLAYEEKMTLAKVRKCNRCKTSFTKSDGCNRMTCRCKATMCYICRKPDIDYNHFCRDMREPGKGCNKCTKCSLWSNPEEDDERAVQEIKKEALEERRAKGFDDDKLIGAPDEPKKPEPPQPQAQPPPPPQPAHQGQEAHRRDRRDHRREREHHHHHYHQHRHRHQHQVYAPPAAPQRGQHQHNLVYPIPLPQAPWAPPRWNPQQVPQQQQAQNQHYYQPNRGHNQYDLWYD